jgi:hypothetical protein
MIEKKNIEDPDSIRYIEKQNKNKIRKSIFKFLDWLKSYGFVSYDQFDFWGSKIGIFGKLTFLKNKILGTPIVIPLQILESFLPHARFLFARKKRFAIGDAHFALGFINLFRYFGDPEYLDIAKNILSPILASATETESGIGWGYPYIWVTEKAIYPATTPFVTVTPYCFYALLEMYQITHEEKYLSAAKSAARFAAYDLNEKKTSDFEISASYSPIDTNSVINANSYRAALLLKAGDLFDVLEYKEKAELNIRYVISNQNEDGSWFYSPDSLFIDNFHTCFVLKNLYKSYLVCKDATILQSIRKGYKYYRRFLFRSDNTPIHFARARYPKFRKIEMYDYAEGISLGVLLKNDVKGALTFAEQLAEDLINKFQLDEGYFITRISTFGTRNKIPYLRWPQAQIFYALTNLLCIIG